MPEANRFQQVEMEIATGFSPTLRAADKKKPVELRCGQCFELFMSSDAPVLACMDNRFPVCPACQARLSSGADPVTPLTCLCCRGAKFVGMHGCKPCKGTHQIKCRRCLGKGSRSVKQKNRFSGQTEMATVVCGRCDGRKIVPCARCDAPAPSTVVPCGSCEGLGKVPRSVAEARARQRLTEKEAKAARKTAGRNPA